MFGCFGPVLMHYWHESAPVSSGCFALFRSRSHKWERAVDQRIFFLNIKPKDRYGWYRRTSNASDQNQRPFCRVFQFAHTATARFYCLIYLSAGAPCSRLLACCCYGPQKCELRFQQLTHTKSILQGKQSKHAASLRTL